MERVTVQWIDATLDSSWMLLNDAMRDTPIMCTSVGYWLGEDDKVIRICQTITAGGKASGILIIPKNWVKKVKKTKLKKVKNA